ncbi:hypothetical protein GCM10025863_03560 [Microbacterium suwonense]|uniref:TRAM domain-containing protein n=1 Tax=Microbacterium suwonense TaxID=683047 RepID=A0ABM8FQY3_9MICO|nr:hypothetical protein GCM10025863_03560 [Microbacterium suwonense]
MNQRYPVCDPGRMTSSQPILDLDITGIAHGGTFIARHEGRVVFVPDAIPGERVRVRITDAGKASFWRAEALEVLEASPHRRAHVWAEADISRAPEDRVGGADLGHIILGAQRVLKRRVLQEALDKFAGPGIEAPEVQAVDAVTDSAQTRSDGTGWRTRVSLHVDADGRVGPYAARSHRVIDVASLPLARPAVAEAAFALRPQKPGRVDLVEPGDGRVRVLPRPEGARRGKPQTVFEFAGGRRFRVDAGGFWQVHPQAADALHRAVGEALGAGSIRMRPISTCTAGWGCSPPRSASREHGTS